MIEIINLSKSFGDKKLFERFSLTINDGDFIAFSGVSGCGKTTLLNMIGSIEQPDKGDITLDGKSIFLRKNRSEYLKKSVGFLFQNFALVDNKTVLQNLNLVKNDCRTNVTPGEALHAVGLPDVLKNKVYTLSGGEQQRVALARLMIKKCKIILADEPTGSLDTNNKELVFKILKELNEQGKTVIVVSHDEAVKNYVKRIVEL